MKKKRKKTLQPILISKTAGKVTKVPRYKIGFLSLPDKVKLRRGRIKALLRIKKDSTLFRI